MIIILIPELLAGSRISEKMDFDWLTLLEMIFSKFKASSLYLYFLSRLAFIFKEQAIRIRLIRFLSILRV